MAKHRTFIPYHYGDLNAVLEKPCPEPKPKVFWLMARVVLLVPGAIYMLGGAWHELTTSGRVILAGFFLTLGLFLLGIAVVAAADLLGRAMAFRRRIYDTYASLEITECLLALAVLNVVAIASLVEHWAAGNWPMFVLWCITPAITAATAVVMVAQVVLAFVEHWTTPLRDDET